MVDEELDGLEVGGGLIGVELAEGGEDGGLEGLGGRLERMTSWESFGAALRCARGRCTSASRIWPSTLVSWTSAMTPMTRASDPPTTAMRSMGSSLGQR